MRTTGGFTVPTGSSVHDAGAAPFTTGPRVGVAGDGGSDRFPYRFWIPGDLTVSAYKPGRPPRR